MDGEDGAVAAAGDGVEAAAGAGATEDGEEDTEDGEDMEAMEDGSIRNLPTRSDPSERINLRCLFMRERPV